MKTRTRTKTKLSPIAAILIGSLLSIISLIVCALIGSAILIMLEDPTGNIGISALVIFLISGAICGFSISKSKGEGGILTSVLSSGIAMLILILISLIALGGKAPGRVFMNALCYILVSTLFAYLGRKREKKKRR